MVKLKKIFTATVLATIIIISGLLLMACSSKVTSSEASSKIVSSLSRYKENTQLFSEKNICGIETDYCLNDFAKKNSVGAFVGDYNHYLTLTAVGLNYIEDNYALLENFNEKYNFSKLNKQVEEMDKAYNNLCIEFNNMKSLDGSANYNIYNGYFARYEEYARYFINEVYDVAEELGSSIVRKFGDGIGEEELDQEKFNTYVSYNKFLISKDYKNFFMDSSAGKVFDKALATNAKDTLLAYCLEQLNNTNLSTTLDEAKDLKEILKAVNVDRSNATKSLKEFSLYDFYTTFDGSIIAYEKNNKDASKYFAYIENYFDNGGILYKLYTYFMNL